MNRSTLVCDGEKEAFLDDRANEMKPFEKNFKFERREIEEKKDNGEEKDKSHREN